MHRVRACVDGQRRTEGRARDRDAGAGDRETGDDVRWRDVDHQLAELGLDGRDALAGGLLALGPVVERGPRQDVLELGPRRRELALLLVASREVHLRARRRIEPVALLELGAGLGELVGLEQLSSVPEQRLRGGFLFGRLLCVRVAGARQRGREQEPRDRLGEGRQRKGVSAHRGSISSNAVCQAFCLWWTCRPPDRRRPEAPRPRAPPRSRPAVAPPTACW